MPTFFANLTTVQLSVAGLKGATTEQIRTAQGTEATENTRDVAFEIAKGSRDGTLNEIAINGPDGHYLQFLGKLETMPFYMVRAGRNFFAADSTEKRNRRPARVPLYETKTGVVLIDSSNKENTSNLGIVAIEPDRRHTPDPKPHALCLTVYLSNASFIRNRIKRYDGAYANDLKVDVFFNGQFCASSFIPRRFCGDTSYGMTEHIVRFTGYRIARLVEKPWIFVPPNQGPDGKERSSAATNADALQRWKALSDALYVEADKAGQNDDEERSVLGEYLESLASLHMPQEVRDIQQGSGANFGVIDVVVTYGQGAKHGPEQLYLCKPTPMKLEGYESNQKEQLAAQTPIVEVPTPAPNAQPLTETRSEALAMAKGVDESLDSTPEPLYNPPNLRSRITRSQAPSNGTMTSRSTSPMKSMLPSRSASPAKPNLSPPPKRRKISTTSTLVPVNFPQKTSRASSIASTTPLGPPPKPTRATSSLAPSRSQTPFSSRGTSASEPASVTIPIFQSTRRSRAAMPYQHVWTNKQTLAEEIESIAAQAAEDSVAGYEPDFHTLQKSIPRATRASFAGMNPESDTETEVASPDKDTLSGKIPSDDIMEPAATPKLSKIITLKYSSSPLKSGTVSPIKTNSLVYASSQKRRNRSEPKKPSGDLEADFTVPELSRDCVITYAEKGVLRNVGAVRGGKFSETGVLMGVRFLVG